MNPTQLLLHGRLLLPSGLVALLASACVGVQTHSFMTSPPPERLPELAYDEVRLGRYGDHADLLGPVQVTVGPRDVAEFPLILEAGRCYQAIVVEENRTAPLRVSFLDEDFTPKDSAPAVRGAATLFRCPETSENLILSVDGMETKGRVVVGVVTRPQ